MASYSSSSRSRSPASSTGSSSSGLYIPVHRRSSRSPSDSPSRSFSSRTSTSSDSDSAITPPALPLFIYSRDALLNLAKSPLAHLPKDLRSSLREDVPEIITNRKQRKAIEYQKQLSQYTSPATAAVPITPPRPTTRTFNNRWDSDSNSSSSRASSRRSRQPTTTV